MKLKNLLSIQKMNNEENIKKFTFKFKKVTIEERINWFEKQMKILDSTKSSLEKLTHDLNEKNEYIVELENTIEFMSTQDELYSKRVNELMQIINNFCISSCGSTKK